MLGCIALYHSFSLGRLLLGTLKPFKSIMVVRKPIPTESSVLRRQSNANSLPYPLSPTSSDRPNAGDFYTSNVPHSRNIVNSVFPRDHTFEPPAEIQRNPSYGSDMSDDWINEDLISVKSGSQQPTADNGKPIDAQSHTTQQLPLALRAGRPDETPRTSSESQRSRDAHQNAQFEPPSNSNHNTIKSTNPYLRAKTSDLNDQDALPATEESSVDVWAKLATGPPPTRSPPLPPPLELEANDSESTEFPCLTVLHLELTFDCSRCSTPTNQKFINL